MGNLRANPLCSALPFVFAVALMLAGCGGFVRSNVTTFHDLPSDWKGRTIAVLPYEEQQSQTLEWRTYKRIVEGQLRKSSFVVTSPSEADLFAFVGYGNDQGREVVSTFSIPQFGVTDYNGGYTTGTITNYGGGYSTYSGTTTLTPTYGVTPNSTEPSPQVSSTAPPFLIVEGAEGTGYNIIKYAAKYYGLAQSDGLFDIMKVESGAYARPVYIGDSLEEVTELILKGLAAQPEPAD